MGSNPLPPIGTPLDDGTWIYTWERGRQLKSMAKSGTTWNMTYDADGLRTSRIATDSEGNTGSKYYYYYENGLLTYMKFNSLVMRFTYDAQGNPVSMTYNGNIYFYVLNLQGDVMALLDVDGNEVVSYHYNAWGKILSTTASTETMRLTLAKYNPLRYRGYIYDRETGLYYLQSRYYNPELGRFINADDVCYLGVDSTPNSINLFAYCKNNPIMFSDPTGHAPEWWQWLASGAMVVAGVALVATGLGGIAGGALICAGTNSIIGSYTSEAAGGSSTAGWFGGLVTGAICGTGAGIAGNILVNATNLTGLSCIGGLAASGSIAFGMGALGSAVGQGVTALLDNKSISTRDLVSSALVTGSINCLGAVGSGMGSALKDLPLISTTSTALANSLNAAWSVIAEVICDFGGIIPSFLQ